MLKAERETIIRWDSDEQMVHICSYHPAVWRRLDRKGYQPARNRTIKGREVGRDYLVPLRYFRFSFRALDAPRRPAPVWLWKQKTLQKKGRKNKVTTTR